VSTQAQCISITLGHVHKRPKLRYCSSNSDLLMTSFANSAVQQTNGTRCSSSQTAQE